MRTLGIMLSAIATWLPAAGGQRALAETAVSVQQAWSGGQVDVQVYSLGGATGSTIRVDVRRKVAVDVRVEVNPGTVFICQSGRVQNMAGGTVKGEFIAGTNTYNPMTGNVLVLGDDAWHSYLVESYCMDFHKPPPPRGERFALAVPDQRVTRILQSPKDPGASLWAFQIALWMDREGVTENQVRARYGSHFTSVEVRVARDIMKHAEQTGIASIPADMPAGVRVEVSKLFSPDPAVRNVAVQALVKMGEQARVAAPFLAANVTTAAPGEVTTSSWEKIIADPLRYQPYIYGVSPEDTRELIKALHEQREVFKKDLIERRRLLRDRLFEQTEPPAKEPLPKDPQPKESQPKEL